MNAHFARRELSSRAEERQQGAALIVSLIILLVMTVIGLTATQTTSLEEQMAGHSRDRSMAFEAAESALRTAEAWLQTNKPATGDFKCSNNNGLYPMDGKGCGGLVAPLWESISWTEGNVAQLAAEGDNAISLYGVTANPMYIIEDLGSSTFKDTDNTTDVTVHAYRITARATGGTANAVVILQSIYQM